MNLLIIKKKTFAQDLWQRLNYSSFVMVLLVILIVLQNWSFLINVYSPSGLNYARNSRSVSSFEAFSRIPSFFFIFVIISVL